MAGKLISDLNSGTLSLADAMEIDKDVSGTRTSFKTTVKDIVDFANHNVAEEYDITSTYAVDDYVIYESVLYKCIASTTGTFDSTKWTSVVVTDEMGSGGGGGTGGHTIIDKNGNSMAGRSGLQFTGNVVVTDDALNNKTIVSVPSGGGHNYSTTEQIIGTWIDGSTIYEKTIDFGSLPNNDTKSVAHNISNIDLIISIMGRAKRSDGTTFIPMPDVDNTGILRLWANTTNINVKTTNDRSNYTKSYVTIQYTKSS